MVEAGIQTCDPGSTVILNFQSDPLPTALWSSVLIMSNHNIFSGEKRKIPYSTKYPHIPYKHTVKQFSSLQITAYVLLSTPY